ncbi:MAG: murein L,D-transpeptidase family protein [Hyphomicrobiaceae bacterium]
MIGLGATGAADPAAAERAPASEAERAFGKLGTAHLPVHASAEEEQAYGKLGTAHQPVHVSAEDGLDQRLAARGMKIGSPLMIRIFKAEAELEVWMKAGERFELLATYPICNWAGTLGPKLSEGDRQSPEGLYAIGRRQLHSSARWRRSLDIGYPNAFDRGHARTGSSVLVHGGCTSTGCFAMTDQVMAEVFRLSRAALWNGQRGIAVHIFPFRMTSENMAAHADSHWQGFWANLKEAYDLFERTRLPPTVRVCAHRYVVSEAGGDGGCPAGVVATAVKGPLAAPKGRAAGAKVVSHRPGRNARKAYADARKARLATRASRVKPAKHRHVQAVGYRKLPR